MWPGICLLVTTACLGNGPTAPTPFDRQVVLAPGQTATLAEDFSIRFVGVVGDSRCPADAFCVLGGDAIVRIDVMTTGDTVARDLHTANTQPVLYGRARIELVQLDPYPFSARPIEPGEYRATLRVTR
jgi:hypothetical protein